MKLKLKVKQEEYIESHSETIDKELYKRTLVDEEGIIKVVISSPEPIDELNKGDTVMLEIKNTQTKL